MKNSILLLSVCACLFHMSCVVRPHQTWLHPGVTGTVSDVRSGQPVGGASVGFYGRPERSITDSSGHYRLAPVSKYSIIMPLGDPYFGSTVEAVAKGYRTETIEIGHGTGEVYDSVPPKRSLDIKLKAEQGVAPNDR